MTVAFGQLIDIRCWCGEEIAEERRGPAGSWVRFCPAHDTDYQERTGE